MRTLASFILISLDGFYEGPNGEFDWPVVDAEFDDFAIRQLDEAETLGFGRATYEHMAAYWPGRPLFEDLKGRLPLKLTHVKQFDSGNVLLTYRTSP
jgi:dihydrofolate reductase